MTLFERILYSITGAIPQPKPDWLIEKESMTTQFTGAIKSRVFNRGVPPNGFLSELIEWGRSAPAELFAPNPYVDIYSKTLAELGPWQGPLHRRAVMLEVMRVLAGFESSWDWTEGVDASRLGKNTPENCEAGAWQVSYDVREKSPDLAALLRANGIQDGLQFQEAMKIDHPLAMTFAASVMRHTTYHNGPLYKGRDREGIRRDLRGPEHSVYPWLRREAVAQFMDFLDASAAS